MGFSQALSGLNAAASNLDVIGNNIANSETVGFKAGTAQFADVFAGAKAGLGVKMTNVNQNFGAGSLETSGRNLDLAINGNGFFRLSNGGQVTYSRNGEMRMTPEGYLVNAQGARLTGYPAGAGAGGQPIELQIPSAGLAASSTNRVDLTMNLDANSTAIDRTVTAFDATDPTTYSYANSATVFDTLGNSHTLSMFFTKSTTAANTWEVRTTLDGVASTTDPANNVLGTTLTFDSAGTLTSGSPVASSFALANGAATPLNVDVEFDGSTQFGNDFEISSLTQNGYTSGSLIGIRVNDDGTVEGTYTNEQVQSLGTIAMVNFRSPEGLEPIGDNMWVETGESGQPLVGIPGSGQFGEIRSGTIEASNVDLTQELVDLIIAQRYFQANTRTISTQDEVLQSVINI